MGCTRAGSAQAAEDLSTPAGARRPRPNRASCGLETIQPCWRTRIDKLRLELVPIQSRGIPVEIKEMKGCWAPCHKQIALQEGVCKAKPCSVDLGPDKKLIVYIKMCSLCYFIGVFINHSLSLEHSIIHKWKSLTSWVTSFFAPLILRISSVFFWKITWVLWLMRAVGGIICFGVWNPSVKLVFVRRLIQRWFWREAW